MSSVAKFRVRDGLLFHIPFDYRPSKYLELTVDLQKAKTFSQYANDRNFKLLVDHVEEKQNYPFYIDYNKVVKLCTWIDEIQSATKAE